MIYLITGATGTGKTWVMKQIMASLAISPIYSRKTGLYTYIRKDGLILLGKYEGKVFDGSDRLSMSIMTDNSKIKPIFAEVDTVIGEGDRFTNKTFIEEFKPIILKILGDGAEGRLKRGTSQTERQIKSIQTRVNNIQADIQFRDSLECYGFLIKKIQDEHTN